MKNKFVDAGEYYVRDKYLAPDEGHSRHSHRIGTLTVIFAGQLREEFDDGGHACEAWSLLYKPAEIPHATGTGPDGVRMMMVGFAERTLAALGLARARKAIRVPAGAPTALALSIIENTLTDKFSDGAQATQRLLLMTAARHDLDRRNLAAPAWLQKVRALLSSPGSHWNRSEIARRFRVHPVSLTRAFRRCYGCSPGAYSRLRRVDEAIRRLLGQSSPVASVAHELGYHDQSHLTRELNWAIGVPPARLRGVVRRLAAS